MSVTKWREVVLTEKACLLRYVAMSETLKPQCLALEASETFRGETALVNVLKDPFLFGSISPGLP